VNDPRQENAVSPWREVVRLALPTWGAFIAHDLMGLVDMFFVGRLGPDAVAAVGVSGVLFGVVIMIGHGLSTGAMTLVSVAVGARKAPRGAAAVAQSLNLGLLFSLLTAAGALLLAERLMSALGAAPAVAAAGAAYLKITGVGSLPMIFSMILGSGLRGAGRVREPFRAMVIANVVNAVLDPLLIFGLWGLPRLGVAGSAAATVMGRFTGMVLMLRSWGVMRGNTGTGGSRLRLRRDDFRWDRSLAGEVVRIGVFASGRLLVQSVSQLVLMRIVAGFGTAAVAAFSIGLRLQMVVFAPSMGFGVAAAALVGRNVGAGDLARARRAGWTAVLCAGVVVTAFALVMGIFSPTVISFFNRDEAVVRVGAGMLRWMSLSFPFVSAMFVLGSGMGGGGDTLSPLAAVVVSTGGIRLPGAWWLSRTGLGVSGVWAAIAASCLIGAGLAGAMFQGGRWHRTGARVLSGIRIARAAE